MTYSVLVEKTVLPSPYMHKVYIKQWLESLDIQDMTRPVKGIIPVVILILNVQFAVSCHPHTSVLSLYSVFRNTHK